MKRKLLTLVLALALSLGLFAVPAAASEGTAAQSAPISAGNGFFAVVDENDSLWMWGHNNYGQLGNGGAGDSTYSAPGLIYMANGGNLQPCQTTPVKVLDDVVSVSCGEYHTAAVKKDGSLWMWGLNYYGQLGNNGQGNRTYKDPDDLTRSLPGQDVPVKVMDGIVAVSCGRNFTAAISTDGSLWMWGHNNSGQLGNGKMNKNVYMGAGLVSKTPEKVMDGVAAVSCGNDFTAALKTDGTLWMWGSNGSGQLGNGKAGNETLVNSNYQTVPIQVEKDVVSVSCGTQFAAIVKNDGSLWVTGNGGYGMLGDNSLKDSVYTWTRVGGMGTYTSVSSGGKHAAALSGNTLYAWGTNGSGEVGTKSRGIRVTYQIAGLYNYYIGVPTKVDGLENVTAVSCCFEQTIATQADGTVWVWGNNKDRNLGNGGQGNDTDINGSPIQTVPSQVPGLKAKQPGSPAAPSAGYTPPAVQPLTFTDVPSSLYCADAVHWAAGKGITSGTGNAAFSPNAACTKGQIVTFLWRAYGEPEPKYLNQRFLDSNPNNYHFLPVLWAHEMGMAKGIPLGGELRAG